MNTDPSNMTDAELTECFAIEVAKRSQPFEKKKLWSEPPDDSAREEEYLVDAKGNIIPFYATCSASMIWWLDKWYCTIYHEENEWQIYIKHYTDEDGIWRGGGGALTFARAASIALILAHRAEKPEVVPALCPRCGKAEIHTGTKMAGCKSSRGPLPMIDHSAGWPYTDPNIPCDI